MSILHRKVMVLNRSWCAIGMVTLKRAIILTCKGHAEIVQDVSEGHRWGLESVIQTFSWAEWKDFEAGDDCIASATHTYRVPKVIVLTEFDKLPNQRLNFSRRSVCRRDDSTCQYCGERANTIDHVVPKSQGGRSTWENCVCACQECNSRKANRTPEQARMKLRSTPVKPRFNLIRSETDDPAWKLFM